jgi:protocatechuate 3,4-dioxygenase beta subunit
VLTRARMLLTMALPIVAATVALGTPLTAAGDPDACPTSNKPNMLVLVGGSSQTAQLGKLFQTNLQVALANSNGCPLTGSLAGIAVDFVAPTTGASGTFASTASNEAVVGTDAQGVAVAPPFTANDIAGAYTVLAQASVGSTKLSLTNTSHGVASALVAAGPTDLSATVLDRYPDRLQATVLDVDGQPVQGATVTFALGTGSYGAGASFVGGNAQATELTDSSGKAVSPPFLANNVAGPFTATASVAGISEPLAYALRNVAAKTTIRAATPVVLAARVARRYRRALQARVLGGDGRPVEGASVTFTLGSTDSAASASGAGATFVSGGNQATVPTDADGLATSPALRATSTAGRFRATATAVGVTGVVIFSLRNLPGPPAAVSAGVGASQSAQVSSRFPIRLAVTVKDASGNPVEGARVSFSAPARGPSGHFRRGRRTVSVLTNASGIAVAPAFTANRRAGGYAVVAHVVGSAQRAAFALVNEPR